jgi:hypothetical protein
MEAWQGQQRLQRRLTCGGVEAVLLAVVVATALLEARWRATGFFLFAVQRREPLFFLFVFFFSSARRAAAAGVDREEAQRWRCWAEGGRPPPLPLPQASPSFFFSFFFFSGSPLLLFFHNIVKNFLKGRNYYYLPMRKSSSHNIGSTKVKAILVNIKTDQHSLKYLIK